MKVKDLKLLLNQVDDELEISYFSFDEGMYMNIKKLSVEDDWENDGQKIAVIKDYNM